MSAWVIGLALSAGYLIQKNFTTRALDDAVAEHHAVAKPATGGVTTAELRSAWRDVRSTKYSDMAEDLPHTEKEHYNNRVISQQAAVEHFEASSVPAIQGVMLTFDGGV